MPPSTPLTVLLVDDHAIQLTMLRHLFQHAGHQVMEAKNGAEALILLASRMPDLVVSDCQMPLVDGYQLCRLLKDDRATRHLPIILLTAQGGHLSPFWARTCGADRFLVKGKDLHQLVQLAERLVEQATHARAPGLQLAVAQENFSVDSIQRHLSRALEKRLLESALRTAVVHLYDTDLEARQLVSNFLEILQDLVLPGAILVMVHPPEGAWAMGVHGPGASDEQQQEMVAQAAQALGLEHPPTCEWAKGPISDERGTSLRQPHLACQPALVRGRPCVAAISVLVDAVHYSDQERLFDIAAEELARVLVLEQSHQLLYQQAIRDPLTGLYNRRHIMELLATELEEARRFQQPLSLLLMDLDRFNHINHRFGHTAGDQVLTTAAQRIAFTLRKVDRLAHLGGGEFLVLCPRTDPSEAYRLAERILEDISHMPIPAGEEEHRLTISLGVAHLQEDEAGATLVERAQRSLTQAKDTGRNRIVRAGEG